MADRPSPLAAVPAACSPSPSRPSQARADSMNKAGFFQEIQQIDEEAVRRFREEGVGSNDG